MFTSLKTCDLFRFRPMLLHLCRDKALASAEPLRAQIEREVSAEFLADLQAAHMQGRRLFIGTMNVNTRRLVVWDLGAIACSGRPDAADLVRKLLLASCCIPGMAPAVPIQVEVNGQHFTELHADAGGVAEMFVRFGAEMPRPDPGDPTAKWLNGANLYAIVGGKLYLDPIEGKPGCIAATSSTVAAALFALFRADAWRLYTLCAASGMAFHMTAVPQEMPIPQKSCSFDPKAQQKLFQAGYEFQFTGGAWRTTPPDVEPGEASPPRVGTTFTVP